MLRRVDAVNARIQAPQLTVVREAGARGVPSTLGAVSTPAFLGGALRMSPGLAREHEKLAGAFATTFTDTGAALAAGEVSYELAKAIYETVSGLPSKATAQDRRKAELFLLSKADALNAKDLKGDDPGASPATGRASVGGVVSIDVDGAAVAFDVVRDGEAWWGSARVGERTVVLAGDGDGPEGLALTRIGRDHPFLCARRGP